MMFMPTGLAGLIGLLGQWRSRFGLGALTPFILLAVCSGLFLSAGGTFVIEFLQRFLSQDYQALASANAAGAWPPIQLFRRSWSPVVPTTWLVPAALLMLGTVTGILARQWMRKIILRDETKQAATEAVCAGSGSAA